MTDANWAFIIVILGTWDDPTDVLAAAVLGAVAA